MDIVSFGGGLNSGAEIVRMVLEKMHMDYILFADTGCEFPETYDFVTIMDKWLKEKGHHRLQSSN